MKKIVLGLLLLLVVSAVTAKPSRWRNITEKIEIDKAKRVVIDVDLAAGEFRIVSGDIDEIAIVNVEYDSRKIDAEIYYREKGSVGYLQLESDNLRNTNIDTDDNYWDITISKKYPIELNLDMGACEAEIDLGGIPLQELNIDFGAASGVIEFSEPNPERLREINIDAGVSSLEIISLGNANFERFEFSGGVGSFDIDLRGEYEGESFLEFEIGLGSAEIIVPKGLAVQVEITGGNWLSSIDFHNVDLDEIEDDIYETEGFEDAETRIFIKLDIGLGSIDLYWKK